MDSARNEQDWSQLQNEVLSAPFPMVFGGPDVVDGYCSLELGERNIALETLRRHRTECALWYRALKLLIDPLLGDWTFPGDEHQKAGLVLRANLVCLQVSSAKASLDLLLAGYYSPAFATIRHMLETVAQVMYVLQFPAKIDKWEPEKKPPQMRVMINEIKKSLKQRGYGQQEAERFEALYETWTLMSQGSHPSGTGLLQVAATQEDPRNIIGPVYRESFAYVAFDHGLFALYMLLHTVLLLGRASDEWASSFSIWVKDRQLWRTAIREDESLRALWAREKEEISLTKADETGA